MREVTIDLSKLQQAVAKADRPLAGAILGLIDTHSIKTDLSLADDQIRTLALELDEALSAEAGSPAQSCAMALLASAINLYARSMKTTSNHRKTFDRTSKLSDDEKLDHDFICKLRDDAIAHFGPGPNSKGYPWHQDGAFAFWDSNAGSLQVFTTSKRKVAERDVVSRIQRQIHRALMLVERDIQERNKDVTERIANATDGKLSRSTLEACECDLKQFFGDDEAVRHVWESDRLGHAKGTAHHPVDDAAP